MQRRDFLRHAAGATGALAMHNPAVAAASSGMYVSLSGALFNGRLRWPTLARFAAKVGYPGTDFMLAPAMKVGLAATRALLKELNLKPAVTNLPTSVTGNEASFQETLPQLDEAAKFSAAVGCTRMIMVTPASSETPKEELRKTLRDRLSAVSEILARHDVRLGLEFLGPLEYRSRSPHVFIYRMDEMVEFAKECGANIGVLLDSWHWYHAGSTVEDIVAAGKSRIVSVHVSDSAKLPPEQVRDNQRLMPGEGVIDLAGFFQALRKIGYEDGISPEVLGRVPADMSFEDAARLGLNTTLSVMRKAGVA
jgi:sugar phosphate isomerase/epimerase